MKNRKLVLISVGVFFVFLLGFVMGYWMRGMVDIDRCLDAGGRWNYEKRFCDML